MRNPPWAWWRSLSSSASNLTSSGCSWSRTITLGAAGHVIIALDVDVRKFSEADERLIVTITNTLAELERLHQRTEPVSAGS
ncbi:MAG TPA: hypothetical protein VIW24_20400 [Aldersonia sp.]